MSRIGEIDELLVQLEEVLQNENVLWTAIYLPLTWRVFKNKESLHVIVKILEYDDNQLARVLEETIHNPIELQNYVTSYLHWARFLLNWN